MSKENYTREKIQQNIISYLCSSWSEDDDDFLWICFEAVRLQGYNQALKEMVKKDD